MYWRDISEPLRGLLGRDRLDYCLSSLCYTLPRARLTDGQNNSSNGIKLTQLTAVITLLPWYQQKRRLLAFPVFTHTHTESKPPFKQGHIIFFSHKVLEEKLYQPSQLPVGFPRPHTLLHCDLRYLHILRCLYPLRLTSTTLNMLDPVKLILFKGWLHITFCLRNVSLTVNPKWQLD